MSFFTELDRDLYRADAFSGFDAGADFTLGNARSMMWMSQLAYETDHPDKIDSVLGTWKLRKVDVFSRPLASVLKMSHACGVIAASDKATIIAFAGTDPASVQDWVTDFTIVNKDHDEGADHGPGDLHAGFQAAADSVQAPVRTAIADGAAAGRKLFITGHSLGAAIGVITALQTFEEKGHKAEVYGFGAPRALRPEAIARYEPLHASTYRLVHGNDGVARVPPSGLNFVHVGRPLLCARGGTFDETRLAARPEDIPSVDRQGLRGLLLAATKPLDIPFQLRPGPIGLILATLPPVIQDHVPDSYFHALGSPIVVSAMKSILGNLVLRLPF
jgi:triacylglycerol lipase